MLHLRQDDVAYLALGQTVTFGRRGESEVKGKLAWISTEVDEQTRTVKVRVEVPNPDGRLKANTFGDGRIVLREEAKAVTVPDEAVHWEGCCNVVFVRDKRYFEEGSPKFFHVRKVRVGVKNDGQAEIIAGLAPGEIVAARNSVVLAAQLLKSNLGAGCCEAPPAKR
jgi:cobalt-zinc-cadmium efflux system membrane fusion protein